MIDSTGKVRKHLVKLEFEIEEGEHISHFPSSNPVYRREKEERAKELLQMFGYNQITKVKVRKI